MITQGRLKELFRYNNGHLVRISNNKVAGSLCKSGHVNVSADGKLYQASRLVWLYHFGEFPKRNLRHTDGNKLNNKIENLPQLITGE